VATITYEQASASLEGTAVAEDYRRLLTSGYTECREHERAGPNHGEQGVALAAWLVQIAQPWFRAIESLAAEDALGVRTYQGFDADLSGSTPCAVLLDRDGAALTLSTLDPDPEATLLAACGEVLRAARAKRALKSGSFERHVARY
jgi:hypothetical protein